MALDVYFREDVEHILDAVQSLGGDVRTLNAIREAFGLDVQPVTVDGQCTKPT